MDMDFQRMSDCAGFTPRINVPLFTDTWPWIVRECQTVLDLQHASMCRCSLTRGHGLSENVRLSWIYTTHQCAAVH